VSGKFFWGGGWGLFLRLGLFMKGWGWVPLRLEGFSKMLIMVFGFVGVMLTIKKDFPPVKEESKGLYK
jgi:hypothetical protein